MWPMAERAFECLDVSVWIVVAEASSLQFSEHDCDRTDNLVPNRLEEKSGSPCWTWVGDEHLINPQDHLRRTNHACWTFL